MSSSIFSPDSKQWARLIERVDHDLDVFGASSAIQVLSRGKHVTSTTIGSVPRNVVLAYGTAVCVRLSFSKTSGSSTWSILKRAVDKLMCPEVRAFCAGEEQSVPSDVLRRVARRNPEQTTVFLHL